MPGWGVIVLVAVGVVAVAVALLTETPGPPVNVGQPPASGSAQLPDAEADPGGDRDAADGDGERPSGHQPPAATGPAGMASQPEH